jgi:hypothetical protein
MTNEPTHDLVREAAVAKPSRGLNEGGEKRLALVLFSRPNFAAFNSNHHNPL